jgi:hypothetical protein
MNHLKIALGFLCPWWVIIHQKRIIDRLQRKVDRLSGILANPRMLGMQVANEQLELGLKGPICEYMAAVLSGLVLGCPDVENYLELRLQADGKTFVVIVTRPGGGLTPHQLRKRAEDEVAELRERLAELELEGEGEEVQP